MKWTCPDCKQVFTDTFVMHDCNAVKLKCPVEGYHGRWSDPNQTKCSECGWTKPPADTPSDRKTFFDGHWRTITHQGSIGEKCSPPTAEERAAWAADDAKFAPWRFPATADAPPCGTKVYKIITQQDEFFGGKFDPAKLTQLMNSLARDGWRVVAITTADISTFLGTFWTGRGARQEIVVFMEKTVE